MYRLRFVVDVEGHFAHIRGSSYRRCVFDVVQMLPVLVFDISDTLIRKSRNIDIAHRYDLFQCAACKNHRILSVL